MKKRILSLLIITLMIFSFFGCGGQGAKSESYELYSSDSSMGLYNQSNAGEYLVDYEYTGTTDIAEGENYTYPLENRKIIYTSNMEVETLSFDKSSAVLFEQIAKFGGYVASSETYGGESYDGQRTNRRLYVTAKIPAENYESFLTVKNDLGNVTSFSESTEDVTTQYMDIQARLGALKTQEARLLELIAKAENVDELLRIESELSNVRYEIEYYTAQIKNYDNLISFSTVNIVLKEANEYSKINSSFGYKLMEALKSSWVALINFLQDILIWLIRVFPFVLLFGVIALIVCRGIKKTREKRAAKLRKMYFANNQNSEKNDETELTSEE